MMMDGNCIMLCAIDDIISCLYTLVKDNFRTHFVSMGPPSFYGINRETYGLDVHSDSQKV